MFNTKINGMKKYKLLTQEGYFPDRHLKGKVYQENYKRGSSSIAELVIDFPEDWEEVVEDSIDDRIDDRIKTNILNLELLIESKVLLRDIEAYKQTISTSESEVYIELANDQIKRAQERLLTIEKQIAE